jgi:hypothetical protein
VGDEDVEQSKGETEKNWTSWTERGDLGKPGQECLAAAVESSDGVLILLRFAYPKALVLLWYMLHLSIARCVQAVPRSAFHETFHSTHYRSGSGPMNLVL